MIHETRIIPISSDNAGKLHPSKNVHLEMGDARGHWEGDTLVVETTNFKERSIYRNGNPKTFRLVERFTPTSKKTLEWSVTVDDPHTWTRPWTFTVPLSVNNEEPVYEYACHEGNYAVRNMLSATRAEEKAESATVR